MHLTETCDDDGPHLVTHVETTLATTADNDVVDPIHAELERKGCVPGQHLVDIGYGSGRAFVSSWNDYGMELLGPARPDISWQARTEGAYDLSYFEIDFASRTVTCPQGNTTNQWYERTGRRGKPAIFAQFPTAVCRGCPVRQRCTTARTGRQVGFIPEAEFRALQAAREHGSASKPRNSGKLTRSARGSRQPFHRRLVCWACVAPVTGAWTKYISSI